MNNLNLGKIVYDGYGKANDYQSPSFGTDLPSFENLGTKNIECWNNGAMELIHCLAMNQNDAMDGDLIVKLKGTIPFFSIEKVETILTSESVSFGYFKALQERNFFKNLKAITFFFTEYHANLVSLKNVYLMKLLIEGDYFQGFLNKTISDKLIDLFSKNIITKEDITFLLFEIETASDVDTKKRIENLFKNIGVI